MQSPGEGLNLGPLAYKILKGRGIEDEESIRSFVNPQFYLPSDPLELPGINETVEALLQAVQQEKHICVYGDYDVDGITSTTLLVDLLHSLQANVHYHVPNRFTEGYGMNEVVIRQLGAEGVQVILTCDCGISNHREVKLAKELGMQVLITDHHQLPAVLPEADGIVNPQLLPADHKLRSLPGVGVAYMLAKVCDQKLGRSVSEDYLDLVALGIVADVVPLLKENRYLLQLGLNKLRTTRRAGLHELIQVSKLNSGEITEEDIGFQLVPRLNAAGRLRSASLAVELLLSDDPQRARDLAVELNQINLQRRLFGEEIFQEALSLLSGLKPREPIVLFQPHWHHGLIGIIAGRLAELYKVPVLLMSLKEDNTTVVGSARSIPGVHMFKVLEQCEGLLIKFGGHAGAAGFSLRRDQLELFCKAIAQQIEQVLPGADEQVERVYDLEVELEQLGLSVYHELRVLSPFGEGNPPPQLCTKNIQVLTQSPTAEQKHLRLVLTQGNTALPAMWWWSGGKELAEKVDAIYSLGRNVYKEKESLQLILKDSWENTSTYKPQKPKVWSLEILDLRREMETGANLAMLSLPQFFAENPNTAISEVARDRYSIESCENLVLFSIPPSLRVLLELLAIANPQKLVLAYPVREPEPDKEFLQKLLGLVKFVVVQGQGRTGLPELAAFTGHMEVTVTTGLSLLQARGLINFAYDTAEGLYLTKGDGRTRPGLQESEARLRSLLAETRAFRRFLHHSSAEKLKQLLSYSKLKELEDLEEKL